MQDVKVKMVEYHSLTEALHYSISETLAPATFCKSPVISILEEPPSQIVIHKISTSPF